MTVFNRDPDGTIRLHWASELLFESPDPGQDQRHLGTVEPLGDDLNGRAALRRWRQLRLFWGGGNGYPAPTRGSARWLTERTTPLTATPESSEPTPGSPCTGPLLIQRRGSPGNGHVRRKMPTDEQTYGTLVGKMGTTTGWTEGTIQFL